MSLFSKCSNGLRGFLGSTLNWNSLGIPEFIQKCNAAIHEFHSMVKQIHKNEQIINGVIGLAQPPPAPFSASVFHICPTHMCTHVDTR